MAAFINEGGWDRIARIVLGTFLLLLGWSGMIGGTAGLALKIVGFLPLVTGLVGWCPLYALLGISTVEKQAVT